MSSAVKKREQGQMETRINATSPAELGELEEGINKMASSLQVARNELKSNVEQFGLEQQLRCSSSDPDRSLGFY